MLGQVRKIDGQFRGQYSFTVAKLPVGTRERRWGGANHKPLLLWNKPVMVTNFDLRRQAQAARLPTWAQETRKPSHGRVH